MSIKESFPATKFEEALRYVWENPGTSILIRNSISGVHCDLKQSLPDGRRLGATAYWQAVEVVTSNIELAARLGALVRNFKKTMTGMIG